MFRPASGAWFIRTEATQSAVQWGQQGDIPAPLPSAARIALGLG